MITKNLKVRSLYVAGILAGVLGGAFVTGPMLGVAADDQIQRPPAVASTVGLYAEPDPSAVVAVAPFPVNEHGLTYGSGMFVDEKNLGPDLVAAYGSDGTFGDILASERDAVVDRNLPIEGLVDPTRQSNEGGKIPLYKQDGVTVIGSFEIQAPTLPGRSK